MQVGDVVVYNGPVQHVLRRYYYYVYSVDDQEPKAGLLQISEIGAGWILLLPKNELVVVGRVSRLLDFEEQYAISNSRTVPSFLQELLQPWLGEHPR